MKVAGITIGPIAETMNLATRPAMLWYASAVFSKLAFILCKNIRAKIHNSKLLAPCIEDTVFEDGFAPDGIGKYHDRVIFEAENVDNITDIINESKLEIAEMISNDKNGKADDKDIAFILDYIQISYCVMDKESIEGNIILEMSEPLDALEQMRCFNPDNTNNTFSALFDREQLKNSDIGNSTMLAGVENSQLKKANGYFRSVEDIATAGYAGIVSNNEEEQDKPCNYYAIIQADGDRMGDYLKTLDNADIQTFSKNCIAYAEAVSEKVGVYGGMTIYAGGDDLLAIVPVLGRDNKNIFDLCAEVGKCFDDIVKQREDYPTVSIGVAIRRIKFPLFEALNSAGNALYDEAKKDGQNSICIDFQKSSGQSVKIRIPAEQLDYIKDIMQGTDAVTSSAICIMDEFMALINTGIGADKTIENIFENLYDNSSQGKHHEYIKDLADRFNELTHMDENRKISVYDCNNICDVKTFEGILRIKNFLGREVRRNG